MIPEWYQGCNYSFTPPPHKNVTLVASSVHPTLKEPDLFGRALHVAKGTDFFLDEKLILQGTCERVPNGGSCCCCCGGESQGGAGVQCSLLVELYYVILVYQDWRLDLSVHSAVQDVCWVMRMLANVSIGPEGQCVELFFNWFSHRVSLFYTHTIFVYGICT